MNRPEALNALDAQMLDDLIEVMTPLDKDPTIGCFVLTGSTRAFAAGADIAEMSVRRYLEPFASDMLAGWEAIARLRTPSITAVSGFALGGGRELAMMCDGTSRRPAGICRSHV